MLLLIYIKLLEGMFMDNKKIELLKSNTIIKNSQRFDIGAELERNTVESALENAVYCLKKNIDRFKCGFPAPVNGWWADGANNWSMNRYKVLSAPNWESGMWTGVYWMAYEITGDIVFREAAESHVKIFEKVAKEAVTLNDHDTGFKFSPSCVAAYKLTGNEAAKNAAIRAAEIQLEHYCPVNKFIINRGTRSENDSYNDYRTLVDSMLNIPLFFWATEVTGDKQFYTAAVEHYNTTLKYLIRDDGSSYHHYQFDPKTLAPVKGITWQGNRDESCWSRGQAWLVFGYPIAYGYTKDEQIFDVHRAVSYHFLNNLPSDSIPYWDFDFNDGSLEPRDSSASAVATAGLLEMCKYLSDSSDDKLLFKNAAGTMLKAMIEKCANTGNMGDGLLQHATGARPLNSQIDTYETYGDYFYMESLMRWLNPEWKAYW